MKILRQFLRHKTQYYLCFLPFVASISLADPNPLLRKPWIMDSEAEESRSIHRLFQSSVKIVGETIKQDRFGRNYRITPALVIHYMIDDSYRKEFPVLSEADMQEREMLALVEERREIDAIFLGKGIALCHRILKEKDKNINPIWAAKANRSTNDLLKKYEDKRAELFSKTDPYGCYINKGNEISHLILESDDFRYRVHIPNELVYEGLFRKDFGRRKEDQSVVWNLIRFSEFMKKSEQTFDEEMAENILLQEAGITEKSPKKIIFSLGTTFDKVTPSFNEKTYFRFWDERRGLQSSILREKKFTRTKENEDYLSRWEHINEIGQKEQFLMKEAYFYKRPLGYFLSLSYPESEKEKAEKYWNLIRRSFSSKEY